MARFLHAYRDISGAPAPPDDYWVLAPLAPAGEVGEGDHPAGLYPYYCPGNDPTAEWFVGTGTPPAPIVTVSGAGYEVNGDGG